MIYLQFSSGQVKERYKDLSKQIDSQFQIEEGYNLLNAIANVKEYPERNLKPEEVVERLLGALFAPFIRKRNRMEVLQLTEEINREIGHVIEFINPYAPSRRGKEGEIDKLINTTKLISPLEKSLSNRKHKDAYIDIPKGNPININNNISDRATGNKITKAKDHVVANIQDNNIIDISNPTNDSHYDNYGDDAKNISQNNIYSKNIKANNHLKERKDFTSNTFRAKNSNKILDSIKTNKTVYSFNDNNIQVNPTAAFRNSYLENYQSNYIKRLLNEKDLKRDRSDDVVKPYYKSRRKYEQMHHKVKYVKPIAKKDRYRHKKLSSRSYKKVFKRDENTGMSDGSLSYIYKYKKHPKGDTYNKGSSDYNSDDSYSEKVYKTENEYINEEKRDKIEKHKNSDEYDFHSDRKSTTHSARNYRNKKYKYTEIPEIYSERSDYGVEEYREYLKNMLSRETQAQKSVKAKEYLKELRMSRTTKSRDTYKDISKLLSNNKIVSVGDNNKLQYAFLTTPRHEYKPSSEEYSSDSKDEKYKMKLKLHSISKETENPYKLPNLLRRPISPIYKADNRLQPKHPKSDYFNFQARDTLRNNNKQDRPTDKAIPGDNGMFEKSRLNEISSFEDKLKNKYRDILSVNNHIQHKLKHNKLEKQHKNIDGLRIRQLETELMKNKDARNEFNKSNKNMKTTFQQKRFEIKGIGAPKATKAYTQKYTTIKPVYTVDRVLKDKFRNFYNQEYNIVRSPIAATRFDEYGDHEGVDVKLRNEIKYSNLSNYKINNIRQDSSSFSDDEGTIKKKIYKELMSRPEKVKNKK